MYSLLQCKKIEKQGDQVKDTNALIHHFSVIINKWDTYIKEKLKKAGYIGVVPNHGPILRNTADFKGDITVTELAQSVSRPLPSITETLNKLEKLGYIIRLRDQTDKRIVYIRLTESGKVLDLFMSREVKTFLDDIFECFSDEDKETLLHLMGKCNI